MQAPSFVRFESDAADHPEGHFDFSVPMVPPMFPFIAFALFSGFGLVVWVLFDDGNIPLYGGIGMGVLSFVAFTVASKRLQRFCYDGRQLIVDSSIKGEQRLSVDECDAFFTLEKKTRRTHGTSPRTQRVLYLAAKVNGETVELASLGTVAPWAAWYLKTHLLETRE